MTLTLEIAGPQAQKQGPWRKEFRATGGTIGRLPDSTLVLDDPYVSSRHALIHYLDGVFYIEDKSRNGISINSPDHRLESGRRYPLNAGDRIFIDPYEIRVSIAPESSGDDPFALRGPDDPFAHGDLRAASSSRRSAPPASAPYPAIEPLSSEEVDPLKLFPERNPSPPGGGRRSEELYQISPEREHYVPPAIVPPEPERVLPKESPIPDDYDPLLGTDHRRSAHSAVPVSSPGAPQPSAGAASPLAPSNRAGRARAKLSGPSGNAGDMDLARVLSGAGLDPEDVTDELARNFGQILRVVVAGVMDVLQARQKTKDEFRIGMTSFKPADNNPLKFSVNVDDALHNLLVKRNAAYLGPVEAFEDAFEDVRNHQMAMLAGVRVAFEAMLARFDPDRLQEQFDRRKKGALVSVPAKLRYWDLYRDWIHDMVHDVEGSFRELFGDEFAQAYEEQLRRLKAQARPRKG